MISHKELMDELGVSSIELVNARKMVVRDDEHYRKNGKTYYKESAEGRLRVHFEVPDLLPRFETLKVIKQCRNPRWVDCDKKGQKVKVAIPKKLSGKLDGKPIKVEAITDGEGRTSYRHESLSR